MIDSFADENEFLSNSFPSKINMPDGRTAPTVEHYFQAMKTDDFYQQQIILDAETSAKAFFLGREVNLREDWEEVKDEIMTEAITQKFKDKVLREKLLNTGKEYLKKGNTCHDNYWGGCNCDDCKEKSLNKLGFILMEVRNQIEKEN